MHAMKHPKQDMSRVPSPVMKLSFICFANMSGLNRKNQYFSED